MSRITARPRGKRAYDVTGGGLAGPTTTIDMQPERAPTMDEQEQRGDVSPSLFTRRRGRR